MPVASLDFLLFTLLVLAGGVLAPARALAPWLLLASWAFAATWVPWSPLLLAGLTAGNFLVAERIREAGARKRAWLWLGIALNVGTILALRRDGLLGAAGVVGLSFYGLQAISYLADTYTGALRVRPTLLELAVYLAYFPKLVAGPLERPDTFVANLRAARPGRPDGLADGVTLLALGAVRKLVLADALLGLIPDDAFSAPASHASGELLYALLAYVFYLYNDFAGYSDLARGASALFGIPLPVNFAQPFLASSFSEFWSRWHASLSRWLRGYVYLPVSRALLRRRWAPRSLPNLLVPPMAAMMVSGLWHGATGGMMLWGVLQGSFLIADRVARPGRRIRAEDVPLRARMAGRLSVFVLVTVALTAAHVGLANFPVFWLSLLTNGGWAPPGAALSALLAASMILDVTQYRAGDQLVFQHWPRPVRAGLLALTVTACVLATGGTSPAQFVYAAF